MADSWNPTTPLTWTDGNLTVANLNAEVRDRMEALRAGQTDSSADSDIWLAVKTGTLSARSSVTHKAGRFYRTTDTHELFISDGTNWRHCGGAGAFDDFVRTASTTITPSKSGHVWTEEAGDWGVLAGSTPPHNNRLGLNAAVPAIATLNTGSLLDRPFQVDSYVQTHSTQSAIDLAIVLKYVDASNFIYVQLLPTAFQIHKRIAGSTVNLTSQAFTPAANTVYKVHIEVHGQTVSAMLTGTTSFGCWTEAHHDDIDAPGLATATKVGFRTINTGNLFFRIGVWF